MSLEKKERLPITMTVKLQPEGNRRTAVGIAQVKHVGGEIVADLEREGCTVEPANTDEKGGDFVVLVGTQFVALTSEVLQHRAQIEQTIGDIATLSSLFAGVSYVVKVLKKRLFPKGNQPTGKQKKLPRMYIDIDGVLMPLDPEKSSTQELLLQFVQLHPEEAKRVDEQSHVEIQAEVPEEEEE